MTIAITAREFMRGYVEYLVAQGYDVTLVADGLEEYREEFSTPFVDVRSVQMERSPHPVRDIGSIVAMLKLVRNLRPDAIIYATPKASLVSALCGFISGVPVRIYHLWGLRCETTKGLSKRLLILLEKLTCRLSTVVIANSKSLAERAVNLGVVRQSGIHIPGKGSSHGVDSDYFSPDAELPPLDEETDKFLKRTNGPTIAYIGRLHPDKGIDTLLAAAELLHRGGQRFRLLLVGGDEGEQSLIDSVSRELPLWCTGSVEDVRPYLRVSDVLVLMSLREGFPNVVLEAAAMEVPAVVSDATGCIDSVIDRETGFIVPVGDIEGLVHSLQALVSEDGLRSYLGHQARVRAVSDFQPKDVWKQTETILARQLLVNS